MADLKSQSSSVIDLVNAFDYGNSRKGTPSFSEMMKLAANLYADVGKSYQLLVDAQNSALRFRNYQAKSTSASQLR
jgi:hypothetical protein